MQPAALPRVHLDEGEVRRAPPTRPMSLRLWDKTRTRQPGGETEQQTHQALRIVIRETKQGWTPSLYCWGFRTGPSVVPVPVPLLQNHGFGPNSRGLAPSHHSGVPKGLHLDKVVACWLSTQPQGWSDRMVARTQGHAHRGWLPGPRWGVQRDSGVGLLLNAPSQAPDPGPSGKQVAGF